MSSSFGLQGCYCLCCSCCILSQHLCFISASWSRSAQRFCGRQIHSYVYSNFISVCRYLCGLAVDPCGRVSSLCTTPVISASSVNPPHAMFIVWLSRGG